MEETDAERLERYRKALSGIAANSTACSHCQLMAQIARKILDGWKPEEQK